MTRRTFGGLPIEVIVLIALVVGTLVVRRCRELDEEARQPCASHPCAEGLEPVLIEKMCVCMEKR